MYNLHLQPIPAETSYIINDLWGHQNTDMSSKAAPVQAWAPGSRYKTLRQNIRYIHTIKLYRNKQQSIYIIYSLSE